MEFNINHQTMTLIFEGCPESVTLTHFQDSPTNFVLQWSICEDTKSYKFVKYSLYGSNDNYKLNLDYFNTNKKLLYETQTRLNTIYTLESIEYFKHFQIIVWGVADDGNHYGGHCGVITFLLNVSYDCD